MKSEDSEHPNDFYHKEHIWAVGDTSKVDDSGNLNVNKRKLGNFMLLNKGLNLNVQDKPPEVKVDAYFEVENNVPNTLMIRELKEFFDEAKEEEDSTGWRYKTSKYWYNIYQRFLDKREEKMINFALERWRISELRNNIPEVKLDSLNDKNEIYNY